MTQLGTTPDETAPDENAPDGAGIGEKTGLGEELRDQQTRAWNDLLSEAFGILLGRPLDEFDQDTTYGAFYCCYDLSLELFEEGFDPRVLAGVAEPPFTTIPALGDLLRGWDLITPHWSIDLAGSMFHATEKDSGTACGVPELEAGLPGAELARILAERSLSPDDLTGTYPHIEFRASTDGSLLAALQAVTGTHRGPDHLFPLSPAHGLDPRWDELLRAVPHPGLRDHLRHLCRTANSARCDGAYFLADADPGLIRPRPVTAAWAIGEGQAWSAVIPQP